MNLTSNHKRKKLYSTKVQGGGPFVKGLLTESSIVSLVTSYDIEMI